MKQTNLPAGSFNVPGFLGKYICLLALAMLGMQLNLSAQNKRFTQREITGAAADKIIRGAYSITEGSNTSYPSVVMLNPDAGVPAQGFVSWFKQTMNAPEYVDFRLIKQEKDNAGMEHFRYVQTFRQVPIDKAHYVIHTRENRVLSFNGLALDVPAQMQAKPKVTEAQALKMATERIGAKQYKWESDVWQTDLRKRTKDPNATYYPKAELCWNVSDDNQTFRLAWRFDIASASPDNFQRVYIDANTGAVILTLPMESNCSAASANTFFNGNRNFFTDKYTANDFRLRDDCQGAIFWIRDWNSATTTANPIEIDNTTNTWTTFDERFGASVLWETREAYLYWLNVHTRNSYNGSGGDVTGYVNAIFSCGGACTTPNNASMSFTGGTMKVGAGNGTPLNTFATVDIIGHEFTHAVTGATSQLVYANESGALNESFSDIFGEMNELFSLGSNDWLLGAERSGGAIRSMSNPNTFNDPDTYQGTNWCDYTNGGLSCTQNDAGGVHTNSGVQNFWFYLLSVGGSGTNDNSDAYSVSGIGTTKASAIAYQTLISLGPNAGYAQARSTSIMAATNLYGGCSNEVKQVTNAWHAVGVGAKFFDATASVTSNYNGRHVSCFNACNGSATVTVTSGVLPTYSWSPGGATTQSVSGLCPGVYTVTVTNLAGLGCTVVKNVTILNTPQLIASPSATSNYNGYNISCNGGNNGSATANAAGGTPPYTYSWSPSGQTTANATGLSAGIHTVTVTDANGCVDAGNVNLTQPPVLSTTATPTTNYNGYNISCNGGNDGAATANPVGGVPPYSYSWNTIPVQTTKTATGLSATTYTVTVTDDNGCVTTRNVTLTEPPPLTTTAAPTTNYNGYNVRCHGGSDGAATASPVGGVAPYSYSWNTTPVQNTKTATGLSATTYTVTVTDANGCTASANTTLTEPPQLTIDAGANQTVYYGYPDSACAKLTATGVSGGVPPYTLMWSTGSGAASITVCPITTTVYYVTVTDKNNCTWTDSVKVCVIDVRCGNHLDKVQLCHNTGSANNPTNTLCVALPAAINHISHGDQLAACGTVKTCNFGNGARMVNTGENGPNGFLTAFPNPFADFTTVRFKVPADQHASLKLYDISGRTIREMYNDEAKGDQVYDLQLDGSNIAAGVYFLTLKTNAGVSYTSKLTITK